LELAVRFGKTLIIQEVDGVEPILYPLLRGDLAAQGQRAEFMSHCMTSFDIHYVYSSSFASKEMLNIS
jgi:hypothetical protein